MNNEITKFNIDDSVMESVVIGGDLSKLTPIQRVQYYRTVCNSLGLNPLTRPFDYITLNNKLTLYAKKDATDQLRNIHGVSIDDVDIVETATQYIVKVKGHNKDGRVDVEVGVVNKTDMQGNLANAQMKAVTKGKRRMTLSLCGLGWLDETEVQTVSDAKPVIVTDDGEIVDQKSNVATLQPNSSDVTDWEDGDGEQKQISSAPAMSYETAITIKDHDGIAYGDIDKKILVNMANSIQRTLNKKDISVEDRTEGLYKLSAIKAILTKLAKEPK